MTLRSPTRTSTSIGTGDLPERLAAELRQSDDSEGRALAFTAGRRYHRAGPEAVQALIDAGETVLERADLEEDSPE